MRSVSPQVADSAIELIFERYPLLLPTLSLTTGLVVIYSTDNTFFETFSIAKVILAGSIIILLVLWSFPRLPGWLVITGYLFSCLAFCLFGYLLGSTSKCSSTAASAKAFVGKPWKIVARVIRTPKPIKNNRAYVWTQLISLGNDTDHVQVNDRAIIFYQADQLQGLRERDTLYFDGRLTLIKPSKPEYEGYFRWLARNRIHLQGNVIFVDRVGRPADWRAKLQDLQEHLSSFLHLKINNPEQRSLSLAMLLGVRADLTPELKESFSHSGLAHLLALSGAHVGVLLSILFAVQVLLRWYLAGRIFSGFLVVGLLIAFPILTGLSPSVIRACGMGLIYWIAQLLHRPQPLLQVLSLMAFIQLVYEPESVLNLGFQLSYLSVLGIGLILLPAKRRFSQLIRKALNYPIIRLRLFRNLITILFDLIVISFAAQLFTAPLVLFYFGSLPTYFLFANLLAWPLSFIILFSGFTSLAFYYFEWITNLLLPIHRLALQGLIQLAKWTADLPGSLVGPYDIADSVLVGTLIVLIAGGIWWQLHELRFRLVPT